jgi:chromosomal replication initiation ATPase DnaA
MKKPDQLLLEFSFNKDYISNDYYVSSNNKESFNIINSWPNWVNKILNIHGEKFSGKSHLTSILEKKTSCLKVFSKDFSDKIISNFKSKQILIIEDFDQNIPEKLLYTIMNIIDQENKYLLITSLKPINKYIFKLPDLISRLDNCLVAGQGQPNDDLIYALLIKNLSDKQIIIDKKLINYIIKKIDRSYEKIFLFIHKIDRLSLQKGKPINLKSINEALDNKE